MEITERFVRRQISAIQANLDTFASGKTLGKQAKQKTAKDWANRLKLKRLSKDHAGQNIGRVVRPPWHRNSLYPKSEDVFDVRVLNSRQYLLQVYSKRLQDMQQDIERIKR